MFEKVSAEIRSKPKLYALLLMAHVVVTSLTWRDIRARPAAQVRGPKCVWRVASALQMGNSLAYFIVGRKRLAPSGAAVAAPVPVNPDGAY